jgi:hypothetical protein
MKLNEFLLRNYGIKQGKIKDIVSLMVATKQDKEGANDVTSVTLFVIQDLHLQRNKLHDE